LSLYETRYNIRAQLGTTCTLVFCVVVEITRKGMRTAVRNNHKKLLLLLFFFSPTTFATKAQNNFLQTATRISLPRPVLCIMFNSIIYSRTWLPWRLPVAVVCLIDFRQSLRRDANTMLIDVFLTVSIFTGVVKFQKCYFWEVPMRRNFWNSNSFTLNRLQS